MVGAKRPFSDADLRDLRIFEGLTLQRLQQERVSASDLAVLRRMVQVSTSLAALGVGPEVQGLMPQALRSLEALSLHLDEPAPGEAVAVMCEFHQWFDAQRAIATREEYERAVFAVSGLPAGNFAGNWRRQS